MAVSCRHRSQVQCCLSPFPRRHVSSRQLYFRLLQQFRPYSGVMIATLVAGLEWLVFQPERSFDEVLAAVIALTDGL